jgi:phage host-nuclease inhibitor protein Gam
MLLPEDVSAPPFTDEELDSCFEWVDAALLEEDRGIHPDPAPATWAVTDTGSAEWAMRRLAHDDARIAQVKAEAAEFERQIRAWRTGQLAPLERRAAFFTNHLLDYARRVREDPEDGRATVSLLSGKTTSRKVPQRVAVADGADETVVTWAEQSGLDDLVRIKKAPEVAALKKAVDVRPVHLPAQGGYFSLLHVTPTHERLVAVGHKQEVDTTDDNTLDISDTALEALVAAGLYAAEKRVVHHAADGSWWLVPGVEIVPETVNYDVKPAKP